MTSHFCTCQNTACRCHPSNHDQGCDLCIQKELRKGEIPSCFFNLVIRPGETVEDCTIAAFARRVLARAAETGRRGPARAWRAGGGARWPGPRGGS